MERGWRQHSNEVTTFEKEGTEHGCEAENYLLLSSGHSERGRGLTLEIWDSNGKGLEHPTEQHRLSTLSTWEPLKLPELESDSLSVTGRVVWTGKAWAVPGRS